MKKNVIFLFLMIAIIIDNNTSAQNKAKHAIKEKMVAGSTYFIDQYDSSARIENKNGKFLQLIKENKKQCEYDVLDNDNHEFDQARKNVVKSVFSDARIKQLSESGKNNFVVICICNRVGEIKAVHFIRVNTSVITIQDIKALEDKYLKLKVKTQNTVCPETEYFQFVFPVRFKDYLQCLDLKDYKLLLGESDFFRPINKNYRI